MAPAELQAWLESEDSRKVGWKGPDGKGSGERIGHDLGRRIVAILHKKTAALTDNDYAHMRKVAGYVARHTAQRPENVVTSLWHYSLMNWGHNPLTA